jgi:hypothetical protein
MIINSDVYPLLSTKVKPNLFLRTNLRACFVFLLLVSIQTNLLKSQVVSNVQSYQQGQDIRIEYLLQSPSPVEIKIEVSTDHGKNFSAPLKQVSGDVGKGITAGQKQIVWRVLEEVPELVGDGVVFRLKVSKEKKEGDALVDSHSIGLRARIPYYPRGFLSVGGVSRVFPLNKRNVIEGIVSIGPWHGLALTTLFERYSPVIRYSGFNWYWGLGVTARPSVSGIVSNFSLGIGINLVAGITYKLKRSPLSVSLDFKPTYEQAVLRQRERRSWKGEDYEFALSVRYHFNKRKLNK